MQEWPTIERIDAESPYRAHQRLLTYNFGLVARLFMMSERSNMQLSQIAKNIWPALALGQFEVIFDSRGNPAGYAIWGFLSEEVAARMSSPDQINLHVSEWNDGLQLWLLDFFTLPGHAIALARKLKQKSLKDYGYLRARRTLRGGRFRIITLKRSLGLEEIHSG